MNKEFYIRIEDDNEAVQTSVLFESKEDVIKWLKELDEDQEVIDAFIEHDELLGQSDENVGTYHYITQHDIWKPKPKKEKKVVNGKSDEERVADLFLNHEKQMIKLKQDLMDKEGMTIEEAKKIIDGRIDDYISTVGILYPRALLDEVLDIIDEKKGKQDE